MTKLQSNLSLGGGEIVRVRFDTFYLLT